MSEESTMSQGFNDAELEDIIQEIETLESEAGTSITTSSAESPENNVVAKMESQTILNENSAPAETKSVEENFEQFQDKFSQEFVTDEGKKDHVPGEIMQVDRVEMVSKTKLQEDIEHEIQKIAAPSDNIAKTEAIHQQTVKAAGPEKIVMQETACDKPEMSFQLTGDVEFRMELRIDGEKVKLFIDKSKTFIITFDNGANFQIPLKKAS